MGRLRGGQGVCEMVTMPTVLRLADIFAVVS